MGKCISYLDIRVECIFHFSGGTTRHANGVSAGATANQVALESLLWSRSQGVNMFKEKASLLAKAAKSFKPLMSTLGLWKHMEFNYESTDSLDYVNNETGEP